MADHIYYATNRSKGVELLGGWVLEDIKTNKESLKIGIYYRDKADGTREYALANKGTTPSSISDWINNIQQPVGFSTDIKDSIKFAEYFVSKYTDYEITMIGHSKGGAEAAANAVATNMNAIIFNPASVNLSAYKLDSTTYTGSMTAFIVKGEILNQVFGRISTPIDEVVYLPTQYKVNHKINFVKNIENSIKNHSMEAVIQALKEAGYAS